MKGAHMELGDLFDFEGPGRHRDRRDYGDGHSERRGTTQGEDEYSDARQGWKGRGRDDHGEDGKRLGFKQLLPRLFADKKLLVFAGVVLILVLVGIGLLVLPWVSQGVQFVEKNGIQGVIDRIWRGSGS
jgi:hypothetical protein